MISNTELRYVNTNADQPMPYPGDKYSSEALKELKEAVDAYDTYYKDRKYDVLFSDGQNIEFAIAPFNMAHVVGINHNHLIRQNFIQEFYGEDCHKNSYEILHDIIDNIDDVLKLNELKKYTLINFYRVKTRSEVFSKFSNFNNFNFGCILFDKDIAEKNDYKTKMKSGKFLFTESDDPNFPYYMMGLAPGDNPSEHYVETLFPNNDPERILTEQSIIMPTMISTTTPEEYNKIEATASQKLKLIKSYNELAKKYNANFSYFHDYYATLANQARQDEREKILSK